MSLGDGPYAEQSERLRYAEEQCIGGMILSPEVIVDVLEIVTPADFYQPKHELIVSALERLSRRGDPIDVVSLSAALGTDLDRAGGMVYLFHLTGTLALSASATYYAEKVIKPASLLRAVAKVGRRLVAVGSVDDPDADALDVLNAARVELDSVAVPQGTVSTVEQDVYAAIEDLEHHDYTPTPWRDLTLALGGWRPGCLYYLGARPAVGKSLLGVNIARDIATRGLTAHIASLEMSKSEIYQRLLADVGNVDHTKMTHRTLGREEWQRLAVAAKTIAGLPLSVNESPTQNVGQIRAQARALMRDGQLGVVIVDYLQLMRSTSRLSNRQEEVAEFSRSLKIMARELAVPVIAISQLNRGSEHRVDRMPALSDMRESGSLEQDADGVILLHRDPEKPDEILLLIAKHRHGPADQIVRLEWQAQYGRAGDWQPHHVPSYYDPEEREEGIA